MAVIVRPYGEDDLKAVELLHKSQGFDYVAPDWGGMDVGAVIEVDERVEMAIFFRKTAETFLLSAPGGRKEKLGQLLLLHKEMVPTLQHAGFTDIHCWLPPEIDRKFGKLLTNPLFGWKQQYWHSYSREVA